jgi:uracil phosphoribosyltransferase
MLDGISPSKLLFLHRWLPSSSPLSLLITFFLSHFPFLFPSFLYKSLKHRRTNPLSSAIQTLLPLPVPVHHLGLFREPTTLQPVEYYNNLPYHLPPPPATASAPHTSANSPSLLAIIIDPVIATGGTMVAAIQTLKEWGVERIIVIAILGAVEGVVSAANEWPEATEIWLAGLDEELDGRGMIKPGLGDVGDRLFLTIGKWEGRRSKLICEDWEKRW